MSDKTNPKDEEDKDLIDNQNDDDQEDGLEVKKQSLQEEHKELFKKLLAEELKDIKGKLDNAYKKIEESEKEKVRLKEQAQLANRKRLEDEGKHLEAANLRLAELEETLRLKEERLISLSRDRELDRVLGNLDFRNDFAKQTAFNTILPELVQDDDGSWVHKSGASLADFVKTFAKDPMKDFLFKPKDNSGAGSSNNKGGSSKSRPSSLKGLSTEEMLKHAAAGHFGNYNL